MKQKLTITKEMLNQLYIIENKTVTEIAKELEIGTATLNRKLKEFKITKTEALRRAAISKTKQAKTEDEKLLYSQHISEARKGKGIGKEPWNKGKKGLQTAWNKGLHTPGKPRTSESLEKARQTCLEKYGVEWACQREEARLKGQNSAANLKFEQILQQHNLSYIKEFPIKQYSYDFKVDNFLIEINPYATHNSTWGIRNNPPKETNYHLQKSIVAEEAGYFCIHVFDWEDFNKIISLINPTRETIYARKCEVREVSTKESNTFLNQYHLQNTARSTIKIGLYYQNVLVSLMTFGKPRYNKNVEYELIRYCNSKKVVGGAEKLFNYFITKYNPSSIISYCDKSKFSGQVYTKLNFELVKVSVPAKHWYNPKLKQHITDNLLRAKGFDLIFNTNYGKGSSNAELMLKHSFVEIFDCGQATYIWKRS